MFDHKKQKVYFRGEYVDFKDANVSIANTTFLYGLGVFTGMRAHWNKEEEQLYIFRPQRHYKRFRNSCKMVKFNNFLDKYDYPKYLDVIKDLLRINEIKQDTYIRVSSYLDEEAIGPKFGEYEDDLTIYLYPLGDYVPTGGMKCKVSSWRRVEDNAVPARLKVNGAYVNTALAKSEAIQEGYDEAIVLDEDGHAVEGSAENLFIVRDQEVITPPVTDNILEGITRNSIILIAKDQDMKVTERSIDRTELYFADEVFLTGTGAKVSPVTNIDGYEVGDGAMGPVSQRLQRIYFDTVKGMVKDYQDWVESVY